MVAVVGLAAVLTHAGSPSRTAQLAAFGGMGLVAIVATAAGRLWHRPAYRVPWLLFTAAQMLFIGASMMRPFVAADELGAAVTDLISALGYSCAVIGLLLLARRAGGRLEQDALLDCGVVAIGGGTVVLAQLSLPALFAPGLPGWLRVLQALFPIYDLALAVALLVLGFSTALRLPSYRALVGCLMFLLLGDLGYEIIARRGVLVGPAWLDTPFVVSATLFAVAALHPSMTGLSSAGPRRPREWTGRRMLLFVPAIVLPAALLIGELGSHPGDAMIAAAGSGAALLLLVRTGTALQVSLRAERFDRLTGLPTRDWFLVQLGELLEEPAVRDRRPAWVAVVDLDGYRRVLQSWGHVTGDALVREIAHRLRRALPENALIARVGGDVFAVVLPGDRDGAMTAARSLSRAITGTRDVEGLELVSSASIGVAPAPAGADPVEVLRDADTAMSAAHSQGGDRVCLFEDRMRDAIRRRAEIEMHLRHAAGRGELHLAFQPVVELPSCRVIGAEALLRWTCPQLPTLGPAEFIPIAEETGLIEDLGLWVLYEATRRLADWRSAGVVDDAFTMAINVSTRQLRDDALPDQLRGALAETGVPASNVVLEVTESAMHEDASVFVAVLESLRRVGVQLSVDDFGTGYSSLSYLSLLPVTSVKLDREFVGDVTTPPKGDAIARAVQGIADALDLVVIAEGVETTDQRDALIALGVGQAQGFLWGRPVAAQAFARDFGRSLPHPAGQARSTITGA